MEEASKQDLDDATRETSITGGSASKSPTSDETIEIRPAFRATPHRTGYEDWVGRKTGLLRATVKSAGIRTGFKIPLRIAVRTDSDCRF